MKTFMRFLTITLALLMVLSSLAACNVKDVVDQAKDAVGNAVSDLADAIESGKTPGESDPAPSKTYTVTFVDYDGTVLATVTDVQSGAAAGAPEAPTRAGYTFTGWDKAFDNVTADLTVTAQYAQMTGPILEVSETTAKAGDRNVAVTVALKNNPGVASLVLSVSYDSALTLTGATYNTTIGGQTVPVQTGMNPVNLYWVNAFANAEGDWVFATLTFDVAATADAGDHEINLTYAADNVYNIDEENVAFAVVNGKIVVK